MRIMENEVCLISGIGLFVNSNPPHSMIARELAKKNTVIYAERGYYSENILSWLKDLYIWYARFFNFYFIRKSENVAVVRLPWMLPLYFPFISRFYRKEIMLLSIKVSKLVQAFVLRRKLSSMGLLPSIFFFTDPFSVLWIKKFGEKVSCALIADEQAMLPQFNYMCDVIEEIEFKNIQRADFVFATSMFQYGRRKKVNPKTFYIPNAVEFDFFYKTVEHNLPEPLELNAIPSPRIGYIGDVWIRLDYDLLEYIARSRPDWSLVLVGSSEGSWKIDDVIRLNELPNVHILPYKSREEIPAYLSYFDVGIIPFKVNALTKTMNPQKMYEYLSVGLPVISTSLPEVERLRNVIRIAEDHKMFLRCIEEEMISNNEFKIRERVETARENSWEKRVEQISHIIKDYPLR